MQSEKIDVIKLMCLFHIAVEPSDSQITNGMQWFLRPLKDEKDVRMRLGDNVFSPFFKIEKRNALLGERGTVLFPACSCNLQTETDGARGVCIGQSMACFDDAHLAAS